MCACVCVYVHVCVYMCVCVRACRCHHPISGCENVNCDEEKVDAASCKALCLSNDLCESVDIEYENKKRNDEKISCVGLPAQFTGVKPEWDYWEATTYAGLGCFVKIEGIISLSLSLSLFHTHTHIHTCNIHTQTHRHTDTQTTRTHIHTHTHTETHRPPHTQRHTDTTRTHRYTCTQTHTHTDTRTHRHTYR